MIIWSHCQDQIKPKAMSRLFFINPQSFLRGLSKVYLENVMKNEKFVGSAMVLGSISTSTMLILACPCRLLTSADNQKYQKRDYLIL